MKNTVIDTNRLIAEYMGWIVFSFGDPNAETTLRSMKNDLSKVIFNHDLFYHKKWDELFKVVDKIESTANGYLSINSSCEGYYSCKLKIIPDLTKPYTFYFKHDCGERLEAMYNVVIQYIQWNNKRNEIKDK